MFFTDYFDAGGQASWDEHTISDSSTKSPIKDPKLTDEEDRSDSENNNQHPSDRSGRRFLLRSLVLPVVVWVGTLVFVLTYHVETELLKRADPQGGAGASKSNNKAAIIGGVIAGAVVGAILLCMICIQF